MHQTLHIETPVIRSHRLSAVTGKEIFLKMECYQPVGSFKIRGIGRVCQDQVARGVTELFTSSGGNAGYAVAYAGRQLNAEVNIIVPESTSEVAKETMRAEGAHVDVMGNNWDDAHHEALRLAQSRSGAYIHPFDDPALWQGHASVIDECVNQCHRPDAIVLSVGGGGLFCGLMQGLQRHSVWRDVPVVTAETKGAESLYTLSEEPRDGGYDVRIFTPGEEIPFAGYPTLGTSFVINHKIIQKPVDKIILNLQIGQIPVTFLKVSFGDLRCSDYLIKKISPSLRYLKPGVFRTTG
ncbi:MAG: pyridoxal-phosphate dependent enzyme [bacterium]